MKMVLNLGELWEALTSPWQRVKPLPCSGKFEPRLPLGERVEVRMERLLLSGRSPAGSGRFTPIVAFPSRGGRDLTGAYGRVTVNWVRLGK